MKGKNKGRKVGSEFNQAFSSNHQFIGNPSGTTEDTGSTYPAPQRAVSQNSDCGALYRTHDLVSSMKPAIGQERAKNGGGEGCQNH